MAILPVARNSDFAASIVTLKQDAVTWGFLRDSGPSAAATPSASPPEMEGRALE
jgi:hypothetical protein